MLCVGDGLLRVLQLLALVGEPLLLGLLVLPVLLVDARLRGAAVVRLHPGARGVVDLEQLRRGVETTRPVLGKSMTLDTMVEVPTAVAPTPSSRNCKRTALL